MNVCAFIGRIARDPEVRYGAESGKAVARFTLAIDRGKRNGQDIGADYPSIVCFDKIAELVEKYCYKGQLVGVFGSVATGSYEKDGKKIYTTEFYASRVEFLSKKEASSQPQSQTPTGFSQLTDDDIPF